MKPPCDEPGDREEGGGGVGSKSAALEHLVDHALEAERAAVVRGIDAIDSIAMELVDLGR